ncbi:MAG: hypothetical protein RLZ00_1031 [Pseudomonadota bacterium]|jgi:uncharacterized protein (TIGR02722 family)
MKKNITALLIAASATLLVGCSTAPVVKYGDAKSVETVTTDFGSTDLQQIAESMARSLLESPVVLGSREPPFVTVADIKNRTSEYIDTKAIGGKIRSQLTRSGKVRFVVSIAEMQAQVDELKRQSQSGLYSNQTAARMGNMTGSRYRVEGEITSIVKQTKNVKDVFYNFHLSLINNETGVLEWEDEKEIRKTASR